MMDAFETLGLPACLTLSEDQVREAFRVAAKELHPDVGGGEAEFAGLNEALAIVLSPSRRLKHWMELRGFAVETRGSIAVDLMDLFGEVGAATQRAEAVMRKRDGAKSALVRALLEPEIQVAREGIEELIGKVERRISGECEGFEFLEGQARVDVEAVSQMTRTLVFLEKWRGTLRASYSRLV